MKSRSIFIFLFSLSVCINTMAQSVLSGRVYKGATGTEPPVSEPIAGARVWLLGANNPSISTAFLVDSTYTNSAGWFGLNVRQICEFYFIKEIDPPGYTSKGATTVSGTVINNNVIQYDYPLDNKTLTGNKFWDDTAGSSNNPPVADAGGPYTATVGQWITLVGSGSYDPDAGDKIVTYEWDCNLDGVYNGAGDVTCIYGDTLFAWYSPYSGNIRLRVTDTHGATDTDLASVNVYQESSQDEYDFGDAPSPYKTLLADGGRYFTVDTLLFMGQSVDIDADGQPTAQAKGDDNDGNDDEDGIIFTTLLIPGTVASFTVDISNSSPSAQPQLEAYIDFDGNGTWEVQERIVDQSLTPAFKSTLNFNVPSTAVAGNTFARFMIYDKGPVPPNGTPIGEIEDYMVNIESESEGGLIIVHKIADPADDTPFPFTGDLGSFTLNDPSTPQKIFTGISAGKYKIYETDLPGWIWFALGLAGNSFSGVQIDWTNHFMEVDYDASGDLNLYFFNMAEPGLDFGDAPDAYKTTLASNGAYHLPGEVMLGQRIDTEPDGQPSSQANQDDLNDNDDEDGVTFTSTLVKGQAATVQVDISGPPGLLGSLAGWIDFNGDQVFDNTTEKVVDDVITANGSVINKSYTINVPASAVIGTTYARFRVYQTEPLMQIVSSPEGAGGIGEVEDYMVTIWDSEEELDWGDAPLPYPEASHSIGLVWLGDSSDQPDAESSMQRHPDALGDDNDAQGDDENGLIDAILVHPDKGWSMLKLKGQTISDSIKVAMWLDINMDKDWDDVGEEILNFAILWGATPGPFPAGSTWVEAAVIFKMPAGTQPGVTYARLRAMNGFNNPIPVSGFVETGEVEDYVLEIINDDSPVPEGGFIHGYKWNDLNGNGIKDPGEPGLSGWEIWLDANQNGVEDTGDKYTITDAQGHFEFTGLEQGDYIIGEKLKSGWVQTYPVSPGTHTVQVVPGQLMQAVWFGNHQEGGSGGEGYLKWSQRPILGKMEADSICFTGWSEPSLIDREGPKVVLADDWFCADANPVTGIRWWGVYAGWDSLHTPDYAPEAFHVGIWQDVPAGVDSAWSHPGALVRSWLLERSQVNEHWVRCQSGDGAFHDECLTAFEYFFSIPTDEWFLQEEDSTVWWLSVAAVYDSIPPEDQERWYPWTWLTREHYYGDDAIVMPPPIELDPGATPELHFPLAEMWDLSFELTTDMDIRLFDFGDAPHHYGTLLEHNGAQHAYDPDVYMGNRIDVEDDGIPHDELLGDDMNDQDDEDGVEMINVAGPGEIAEIRVKLSKSGYLSAWADYDRNGVWYEEDNNVFYNFILPAGSHDLNFLIPEHVEPGQVVTRFRFSTRPNLWFNGYAIDGEVEDYLMEIAEPVSVKNEPVEIKLPQEYMLYPNVPNPFNPETQIRYDLPEQSRVMLVVYNIMGQKIVELVNAEQPAGRYSFNWNACDQSGNPVSTGVYLYRMQTETFSMTRKMILIR